VFVKDNCSHGLIRSVIQWVADGCRRISRLSARGLMKKLLARGATFTVMQ
jgi:hypothetical protein